MRNEQIAVWNFRHNFPYREITFSSTLLHVLNFRRALRDDASDMSEYTRNLLKQKFMIAFKHKQQEDGDEESKTTPEENAKKFGKVWKETVANKKKEESEEPAPTDLHLKVPG